MDKPVREAIGCLMWPAVFTTPDIAHAQNTVQRPANAPTEETWEAIVKILSYLSATKDFGIIYVRGSGLDLVVFVDAKYADADTDRRSMSGVAVSLGGAM